MKKILFICMLLIGVYSSKAQFYSSSVNGLALATGTFNPEVSMTFNRKWSGHLDVSFNPFKNSDFRIQHLAVRSQIRYWAQETYRGLFYGFHILGVGYHFGIPKWMQHKYEGVAFGGGIDFGYAWTLSPRWNLEAQIGGGLLWSHYDVSKCKNCAKVIRSEKKTFVAPTRAALSLVYLF